LSKLGKYYFTRNNTTLVAFTIGGKFDANNTGFKLIGTHTDSPNLRLTPISKMQSQEFNQLCVQVYGGALFHTWFDRDLVIGGRVVYKNEKGDFDTTLFKSDSAILRIPNLAIHLIAAEKRNAFEFNKETELRPLISTTVYDQLTYPEGIDKGQEEGPLTKKHYRGLLDLISKKTGIPVKDILDLELSLADSQPSALIGLYEEFISSPRLDNLFSSYHALDALINSKEEALASSSYINFAALFDHEEIGSTSQQGADSNLLATTTQRIFKLLSQEQKDTKVDSYEKALKRSFLISADMAHSVHPNYPEKHQVDHKVKMNQGIVVKTNAQQRYTSDSTSSTILRALALKADIPVQEFVARNDMPCGSTIGPMSSSVTGIKTVDIGAPQLAMHSCREMCGVLDGYYYNHLFQAFYNEFENLGGKLFDY
jgi:aspartyl aminopeptidase